MSRKRKLENNYRDELHTAIEVSLIRKKEYGDDTYKKVRKVMSEFFPEGVQLVDIDDIARYNAFQMIVGKLCRYSECLKSGGHKDSAIDMINYSAMLAEATDE